MPGDPKRATFIADNFLENARLVNDIRGMKTYTGYYKNKCVTVMASGMGLASMGIYAYELFKYYDVEEIIRIGSAGGYDNTLNLGDIVLTKYSYNEGAFAYTFASTKDHLVKASDKLNEKIIKRAKEMNLSLKIGNTLCTEVFEPYMLEKEKFINRIPKDLNILNSEMESFALLYIANKLGKEASCLTTISDINDEHMSSQAREQNLKVMITLALESL